MILPIGHEESSVRRLPWVSFAIIASCFAVLLLTDTSSLENIPQRQLLFDEAVDYWRGHAYLEADPKILTAVGYDVMPNQRSQYLALMMDRALDTAPQDSAEWLERQAELDRLTDIALGRTLPEEIEGAESAYNPYKEWGLVPNDMSPVTLFTHIFMHAGWLHLLSNLFMFFLAGPPLEDRLGRPLFAAFYICAGMFSALFWAGLAQDSNIPLVGASGAIAGVMGAFCIRFWSTNIRFAYFFMFGFRPIYGTFLAKAWLMLPLWFASELFQAWLMSSMGASSGVAYWAHVGGFIFGAGAMLAIKTTKIEERYIHGSIESKVTLVEANPVLEEAMAAREEGNHERALGLLQEAWQRDPKDRDLALSLWDAALASGRPEEGASAMKALVRICTSAGEKSLAIDHWTQLTGVLPAALVDSGTLLRLVPSFVEAGNAELAVKALRHSVDPANESLTTGLAMRIVEEARELDPPSALRAARRVLESSEVHEVKRERMAERVRELEAAGVELPAAVAQGVQKQQRQQEKQADRSVELPEWWDEDDLSRAPGESAAAAAVAAPLAVIPVPPPLTAATPPPLTGATPPALDPASPPPLPAAVPPPLPASDALADEAIAATFLPRFSDAKLVEASPTALGEQMLRLRVADARKAKVEYRQIEAVAVAAVKGLGAKPILLIDLLLNWTAVDAPVLRVIRLRSNGFDPRALAPGHEAPMDALKAFVAQLLEKSGALALPSDEAARGRPFETYEDLSCYEREVLQLDR